MNPQTVAGKQIGRLGDGQRHVAAFHVHIHFWTGEIEGRAIGVQ
jgi:hypothetical protein